MRTRNEELEHLRNAYGMAELESEVFYLYRRYLIPEEVAWTMGIGLDVVKSLISSAERKLDENLEQAHWDGYIWLD